MDYDHDQLQPTYINIDYYQAIWALSNSINANTWYCLVGPIYIRTSGSFLLFAKLYLANTSTKIE